MNKLNKDTHYAENAKNQKVGENQQEKILKEETKSNKNRFPKDIDSYRSERQVDMRTGRYLEDGIRI